MPPDPDETLEANLGTLTDEHWLADHQALIALGVLPMNETRFLFDPDRDPDTVQPNDLLDGGGLDGQRS